MDFVPWLNSTYSYWILPISFCLIKKFYEITLCRTWGIIVIWEAVPGFPTGVANIEGDSKLLFIVLLLGIFSWKGVSSFNEGVSFSDGGTSFLSGGGRGGHPRVGVSFGGGFSKKTHKMGVPPMPPMPLPPRLWQTLTS